MRLSWMASSKGDGCQSSLALLCSVAICKRASHPARPHPGKPKGLGQWAPCNDYTVSNMNLEMGASMLAPTCTRYSHIMMVANVLATICMEFHLI